MSRTELDTLERVSVSYPSQYNVIFHNDDETPMMFVVQLLVEIFEHPIERAMVITESVHSSGKGIAGTYSKEIAEQKVSEAAEVILANGFPLKITHEKVD